MLCAVRSLFLSQCRKMERLHACSPGKAQSELAGQFGVEYRMTASLEWLLCDHLPGKNAQGTEPSAVVTRAFYTEPPSPSPRGPECKQIISDHARSKHGCRGGRIRPDVNQ